MLFRSLSRSERQGLKTNQISAQLKQLVDNQIIEIESRTTGRTHLYRLQERFFNIWYLMRYSTRQDKQRVIWFTKFLEGWCNTNDLKQLFERFNHNLAEGTYELNTVFDRALAYSMVENEEVLKERGFILSKAINYLTDKSFNTNSISILKKEYSGLSSKLITRTYAKSLEGVSNLNKNITNYIFEFNHQVLKDLENSSDNMAENLIFLNFIQALYLKNFTRVYQLFTESFLDDFSFRVISNLQLNEFFLICISKKQYHTVKNSFEEVPELKDRLRPIYFLTMEYLKDEYPNEYLKAGEEMRETIEELKARVQWFEDNLGNKI